MSYPVIIFYYYLEEISISKYVKIEDISLQKYYMKKIHF